MKKITILCMLFASFVLITGCQNALTKKEVEKMISEHKASQTGSSSTTPSGSASVSDILNTAVTEVSGKVWKSARNTTDAAAIGGRTESGFDHEIMFDKESFTFSMSMADGGIIAKDETVNQDYMDLVKTGVAELKDGKLIFKNRMYIQKVYLPKLNKWLSLDGVEYDMATPTDNPFNEYFKDGYHQGYPNVILDVALEVQGTGNGRFRNVENLSTVDSFRIVIKDGKLTLKDTKESPEKTLPNPLNKSYLQKLLENYYSDSAHTFECTEWPDFKKDDGTFNPDPSGIRAVLVTLKTQMRDTAKRKMPTRPEKWGYVFDGSSFNESTDVDLVFDPTKIIAVQETLLDNPLFNPSLPEDPVTNPTQIYGVKPLPPLYKLKQPDPLNLDKAHSDWKTNDNLYSATLPHQVGGQNPYIVKDFDKVKNTEVSWRILYGNTNASTPATLTVQRVVSSESEDKSNDLEKKYRSNVKETVSDFDHDNLLHWKEQTHTGKIKKYKVSYTMTLKFDDISDRAFQYVLEKKVLTLNEFTVKYEALDTTHIADSNFDWVYQLDNYNVMEKRVKEQKWLTFGEIELYGVVSTKNADGTVTHGTEEKLTKSLKRPIEGTTVLNNQTHFFVPSVLSNGKYISKITKFKIIPNMENINFTLKASGFTFNGGSTSESWQARINKDNATSIDISLPDGTKEIAVQSGQLDTTTSDGFENFQGKKLTVQLSGLGEHTASRKGVDRSPSNKKEDWQGYSFVIHFGK